MALTLTEELRGMASSLPGSCSNAGEETFVDRTVSPAPVISFRPAQFDSRADEADHQKTHDAIPSDDADSTDEPDAASSNGGIMSIVTQTSD